MTYIYNLGLRFERIVAQHGDRTAIRFSDRDAVSYAGLNQLVNRTAGLLRGRGLRAGDVVCLSGTKRLHTYAGLLACLKLGVVYAVLDPDSPAERLRKILATCQPRLLVGEAVFLENLGAATTELGLPTLASDTDSYAAELANFPAENGLSTRTVTGANPAYLMFTSGSTGFPKGAVMTHANVLNLIAWSRDTYRLVPDDVLTNVNPLYFDNSVFDVYSALFNGACLVPFTRQETRDPKLLVDKVDALQCTLWFSVPSLLIFLQTMRATDGTHLRSIRRFIFGGEGYPKAKLKLLYEAYAATSEFHNVYGPTECTCICSSYKLSASDFADVQGLPPLGELAPNFAYLILDEKGHPAKAGEIGELCLLGPNVGVGYYNDPRRTAVSFVQNPCNERYAEPMYRTGDLVRLDPGDGKLHIHGRKDHQIKHMGYRIELEEIEAALHCLDGVSEAAVLHTEANGLSRIVAVVACREKLSDEQLREGLRRLVPDYMVPSLFHRQAQLPKNANGKVDRLRLNQEYAGAVRGKDG